MALTHAQPHEVVNLGAPGEASDAGVSRSLLKTDHLQLMQLVLAAGRLVPEHRVPGEITLHCIAGVVELRCPGRLCRLTAGQLVMLPGGEPHAVAAIEDASVLVTVLRLP